MVPDVLNVENVRAPGHPYSQFRAAQRQLIFTDSALQKNKLVLLAENFLNFCLPIRANK